MAFPKIGLTLRLPFAAKSKAEDLIGVDWTDDLVKIVHVHVSQLKREVAHLKTIEVKGLPDDEISAAIQKSLPGFGVKNPAGFLTLPLNVVITRTIEIPSRDPDEIREIVSLQASRHTPYSRAEIIIDTLQLGVVRESYTKVLLVIAPRDIVTRQLAVLEKAGLNISRVFFSPEGIGQACSRILGTESSEAVTAIVHMDATFTSFQIVQKNRILFLRGIGMGATQLLDEREVYLDRFGEELQKSIEAYVADELGGMPSTLLLTGVVGDVTELDDVFRETLRIPIKHQAYFNYFSISAAARQVAAAAKRVSFFNVIAPLLLYDRMKLDLTSEDRKLRRQLEERGRQMVKTGFLVMTVLSLAFAICLSKIWFKSAYLEKLRERYEPVRQEAKSLERVYSKTQLVKDYLAMRGDSIETLGALYDTLPLEVTITGMKYEDGEKFTIRGTSTAMASVFTFVSSLEASDKFKSVKTKYVNNRSENGVDLADFEITSLIERKRRK